MESEGVKEGMEMGTLLVGAYSSGSLRNTEFKSSNLRGDSWAQALCCSYKELSVRIQRVHL
jgi:hypothetical protein